MTRRMVTMIAMFAALLLVLAACGGQETAPSTDATAAPAEEASSESVEATATEEPAEESVEEPAEEEAASEDTAEGSNAGSEGMRHFVVVPAESTASYRVDEEFLGGALGKLGIAAGTVDTIGSTQEVAGGFSIDVANGSIGENEFTVQIDTLTSDQSRRDNWVRGQAPGFLQFPVATFVAASIENAPDGYTEGEEITFQLVGDLTVRDIAVPATFEVTATLDGDTINGVAIADLLLSDFGIDPPNFANTLVVQDAFQVQMALSAVEE